MTRSRGLSPRAALVLLVLFAVLGGLLWLLGRGVGGASSGTAVRVGTASVRASAPAGTLRQPAASAPLVDKARYVLAVVDATGAAPSGYVGGRQFMNDGRGGTTALPVRAASGSKIIYHEYDVNPRRQGVDRGPQRLVVGNDGSAFMTGDHYVTWERLR